VKFLLDENLTSAWEVYLLTQGIESVHWTKVGKAGANDSVVWDFAIAEGYVLITQDLDFTRMLALRKTHLPSVIQIRDSLPLPKSSGTSLVKVIKLYADELRSGCLITVMQDKHRVRLLPINS